MYALYFRSEMTFSYISGTRNCRNHKFDGLGSPFPFGITIALA